MSEKTHHVSEKKKQIAGNIQKLVLEYPIIAAVDMENLPAPQLQQMRAQLRGKIELAMTKRRVIKHTLSSIKDKKKNIEQIIPYLRGMPALIFTRENPFSLFRTLKKSKTSAPAKAGQTAPFDIKLPKGPTSFAPGPVIGELAQLGVKAGVEGGKVVIKEDSIIVKEGKKIPAKAAEILTRMGIEPMEVGLNVTAVYENGGIFTKDVLDIDEEKFRIDLEKAAFWAFNLAVESAYTTKSTITVLISKAFNDAKALGLSQNIIDEGIIDELLSKAERSALGIKAAANIEVPQKPVEEPTITEKKEEKLLDEEKKIIEEEKKLEKEAARPKIESPAEKEAEKEVKKEEEKQLERERISKEKEFENVEEKKNADESTDAKIAEMVAKTKNFASGKVPSAEKIIEEVSAKKAPVHGVDKAAEKAKKEQQEVEKLTKELVRKGTLRK